MILHLTLKKKWFDMILAGEKTEEYREDKQYWRNRLLLRGEVADGKFFREVHFRNGYAKDAPFMRVECLGMKPGKFKPEWSDGGGEGYVIKLGAILETRNIKP